MIAQKKGICYDVKKFIDLRADMKNKIILSADTTNLDALYQFIKDTLEKDFIKGVQINVLEMVCEEIFTNIANYAYQDRANDKNKGDVEIEIETSTNQIIFTFKDKGTPFDPLSVKEPDINMTLDERDYGGLGLLMVKKSVDKIEYNYQNDENIFKLFKTITNVI
ncbi:ATP-binding protein [Acetobacterium paludosum]|uniref:ATP-binding protein n=2 Tax=Acetobacterium paludosum TaxID=52693 RepID=A0A923HR33_9FIRM|nr:ATP-binding protein [Acetobacterium paludosum]